MAYLEDFTVGQRVAFGRYEVTRDEVLEFAHKYDPQPFHLSDEAAAETHFGRLAASGWHSAAMSMAMVVPELGEGASLGSPGIEELRWLKPVHPGDTLRCESEVLAVNPSRSKPGIGAVKSRLTMLNQDDQPVMTYVGTVFYRRRPG